MKLERVVWVGEPPTLTGFDETVEHQMTARGTSWGRAEALPATPEPGTLYLLDVAGGGASIEGFLGAFGEVPRSVAARTFLLELHRAMGPRLVDHFGFAGGLQAPMGLFIGRADIFARMRPGKEPSIPTYGDGFRPDRYSFFLRDGESPCDLLERYLVELAQTPG